jgi:hypothetical protein
VFLAAVFGDDPAAEEGGVPLVMAALGAETLAALLLPFRTHADEGCES